MASYKKVNNKWSVVFDIPSDEGKRCQKRLSGYNSRREAELAYIAFKTDYNASEQRNERAAIEDDFPATNLFEDVFERYLTYQSSRTKDSSYISIEKTFRLHILPFFAGKSVQRIRVSDIIEWQSTITAKNFKYKYNDCILSYFKTFLNYCIEIEELILESPIKKKIKFVNNDIKEEMQIYSPEEYAEYRSHISKERDKIVFDLLYFTGVRKGELIALKWADFDGNKISITKTFTRRTKNGKWKMTSPKTRNSTRDIVLPAFLAKSLLSYRAETNAKNDEFIVGEGHVPMGERYLDCARDKYVRLSDVKRIRIHDFRHSHISYLISCNIDIVTIAKRIGDTVETVLKTYAHILQRKQDEVVTKLEEIGTMLSF